MRCLVRNLLALALLAALVTSAALSRAAAGKYKFCPRFRYTYNDQNLGEDYLKYSGASGQISASYTAALLLRNGEQVWGNYMDALGCTGAVTGAAGTYQLLVTTFVRAPNGALVLIYPNQNEIPIWFSYTTSLPQAEPDRTQVFYVDFGPGFSTINVAATVIQMVKQMVLYNDNRLVGGVTYKAYSEQGTSSKYDSQNNTCYFGTDPYGGLHSSRKFVVAHEFGHAVQRWLFGSAPVSYSDVPQKAMCKCDHITVGDSDFKKHCLQSREFFATALLEGFADYHAADLFNDPTHDNAMLLYAKQVLAAEGQPPLSPPVPVPVYTPGGTYHWMEQFQCPVEPNRGVQIDWTTYFYELNNKGNADALSLRDITDVFTQACGGICDSGDGNNELWIPLVNAAKARFGANSGKANRFEQRGYWHGVAH